MGERIKLPKTTLNEVLDGYPRMFYREPDGNHYKFNKILADEIQSLKQQKTILELASAIKRPIKIWKEQTVPNQYTIKYEINLKNIKRVQLYREGNAYESEKPLLLLDSEELPFGVDNYLNKYNDQINPNLLPDNVAWAGEKTGNRTGLYPDYSPNLSFDPTLHMITNRQYEGLFSDGLDVPNPLTGYTFSVVLAGSGNIVLIFEEFNSANNEIGSVDEVCDLTDAKTVYSVSIPPNANITKVISCIYQADNNPCDCHITHLKLEQGLKRTLWTPPGEIVPTTRYFVYVEDYYGNKFVKGIPENSAVLNDKYDHDGALDRIGEDLGVYRRVFKTVGLTESDYPNTDPPYGMDPTEDDYRYEQRIIDYMADLPNKPLPVMELKNYFGIEPVIEGRWRHITRMNYDGQNKKFMRSKNWNPAVFDVYADINRIPKNISVPTIDIINSVLLKTFPLSKVAYFSFIDTGHNTTDILNIAPVLNSIIQLHPDLLSLIDAVNIEATVPLSENLKLINAFKFGITGLNETLNLTSAVNAYALTYTRYAVQSDFQGGSLTGLVTSDDGIIIDQSVYSEAKNPRYAYESGNGAGWTNQQAIYAEDNNYADAYAPSTSSSQALHGKEFPFVLPDSAFILGLECRLSARETTSKNEDAGIFISCPQGYKGFDVWLNGAVHWAEYAVGGSRDLLGYGSLHGSDLKALEMWFVDWAIPGGYHCYVDWFRVTAWWMYSQGTWESPVLTLADPDSWYKIEGSVNVPPQCGSNTALIDIIDNNTGTPVLSNQTLPVDISSVTAKNIKVRVKLNTATRGYTPKLSNLSISSKNKTKTLL